jgi:hypothetical protein
VAVLEEDQVSTVSAETYFADEGRIDDSGSMYAEETTGIQLSLK